MRLLPTLLLLATLFLPSLRIEAASYVAETGDTLWSLARRHQTTVEELQHLNPVLERRGLRAGDTLTLPDPFRSEPTSNNRRHMIEGTTLETFGERNDFLQPTLVLRASERGIISSRSGSVLWSGWLAGYGNSIIISVDSERSILVASADLESAVSQHDSVRSGQTIGRVQPGSIVQIGYFLEGRPRNPASVLGIRGN